MKKEVPNDIIQLIYLFGPDRLNQTHELSVLNNVNIPTILENLKIRYCQLPQKYIYTLASPNILLSINPYETLPIYGQDVIDEYMECMNNHKSSTEAHIHNIGCRAYLRLISNECNQSIVTMGESGSGKVFIVYL